MDVIGCTGARQTLVLVDEDARPVGPAILWSDRRAGDEARRMRRVIEQEGPAAPGPVATTTGIPLDGASVAAKLAWLRAEEPERVAAASWVLTPRDLIVRWLTGVTAPPTPPWRPAAGCSDPDGRVDPVLAGASARLLASPVPSDRVTGPLTASAAAHLGLAGRDARGHRGRGPGV